MSDTVEMPASQMRCNSEPCTLLFSFSLIYKADAVKKYIYRLRVSLGS